MRELFLSTLLLDCTGLPYIWGGQSPEVGFDCSGLVIYALDKSGMSIPDTNAAGLYKKFSTKRVPESKAISGTLWFYGSSLQKINHVMVCIRRWETGEHVLLGARGGGSNTSSPSVGAFVDTVCASQYNRTMLRAIVDPFINQ
jgi:hypothetical protein